MIPLLTRIDRQLQATADPDSRAELLAERACYMARIGDFAGSKRIIESLRAAYGDGRNGRVSVWIMLVEGVSSYFERIGLDANDRLLRANLLGRARGFRDLTRLSAAWLAHLEFHRGDYLSMVSYLRVCEPHSLGARDSAHCRASIVLGDVNLYIGNFLAANTWYERARRIALDLGDEASISALIHNRAALKVARSRVNLAMDIYEADASRFLALEIDSADYFHRAIGHASLDQLILSLRARELMIRSCHADAARLLDLLLSKNLPTSYRRETALLRCELALCVLRTAGTSKAQELYDSISVEDDYALGLDDQVIFWRCMQSLATELGMAIAAQDYYRRFCRARDLYMDEGRKISSLLIDINGGGGCDA